MNVQGHRVDFGPVLASVRAELLRRQVGRALPAPHTTDQEHWPPNYTEVLAWRQTQLARFELQPELIPAAKKYYSTHRAEFINHWIDTYDPRNANRPDKLVKFPLIMFPRQEELVQFIEACMKAEAGGQVEKSRDMGATWVCIGVSVHLWIFGAASVGWGSQKQEKVDRLGDPSTVFEKIRMAIRALPKVFLPRSFQDSDLTYMRCVNHDTGATIIGEIGDDIGRGGRTQAFFVDEAAHLEHPEAVEASLLETTRVRIDVSSVSQLGTVFHRKREAGLDWEPGQSAVKGQSNVFVMDWSHHPEKTKDWYEGRKSELKNNGLAHVFAREIDRDYAAAVEGVIIPADWVNAAVDAHVTLGFDDSGAWMAGLDVADGGIDRNALAKRKGVVLKHLAEWGERDVGVTTRKTVVDCRATLPLTLQYDCIGIGAGVKSEVNRLMDEDALHAGEPDYAPLIPKGLFLIPWNAADAVLHPGSNVIENDRQSPTNRDFYQNLKAQGWWMLRRRFELTYRAIKEGLVINPAQLISISSADILPALLLKLKKELSQPTASQSTSRLKLVVDKAPEGARSPNLGDCTMMCFWPNTRFEPTVSAIAPITLHGG